MGSRRPYHHGNLKRALLDAALDLIRTTGAEAFTLREVARRAGVSHNAPYRHFRNKNELLAAVATEGYDRLTEAMIEATQSGKNAYDRLRLCGEGFLRFALRYPDHFRVIFDAPRRYDYPETLQAGERAFGTLIRHVEECQAAGVLQLGNSRVLALMYLAVAIGCAKLAITGRLPFTEAAEAIAFDEMLKDALSRGLAPLPVQSPAAIEKNEKKAANGTRANKKATARS